MGLQTLAASLIFAGVCLAQTTYEFGGDIGYGIYRGGSVYSPSGNASAGILNRFAAGAVFGQDLYNYVSGEVRYLYQDGHPYLRFDGTRTDIQGQSQTITYDMLFHLKPRESRLRPFVAAGMGAKDYVIAGPAPFPQPIPRIASLNNVDQWKFVVSVGAGVKYQVQTHVLLRLDFRDYITTFPSAQITPAAHNTARGIFEQFTPLFGVSYLF
jgi:opacity protein-like surface antigen